MQPRSEALPIFPLPNVVLFPRVVCPLHVFEPRYRQLTEHALRGGRRIGMVTVRPEYTDQMAGDPPIYPVGCAGEISRVKRLPDGRYELVLLGARRFRIEREHANSNERLYRIAEVVPLEDLYEDADRQQVSTLRGRVIELLGQFLARFPDASDRFSPSAFDALDDVACANAICNGLALPASEKQGLLEADSIPQRFDRLEGLLCFHLAERARPGGGSSPQLH